MEPEDSQNVLRDVVNKEVLSNEEEDFALAKLMQEQERAFFHARNMYGYGENGLDYTGHVLQQQEENASSVEEGRGDDLSGNSEDFEGSAEQAIDDEELARNLHLQEQIHHERRLMELAGINPDEIGYTDEEEEEEEAYLTDDSVDPDEMTYEELRALGEAVGVVSRGASVDVIQALPLARYTGPSDVAQACMHTSASAVSLTGQEEQCVVCRMEFESGEDVKVLPCSHVFHPQCVDQWLLINKACPICSKEVMVGAEGQVQKEDNDVSGQGKKRT